MAYDGTLKFDTSLDASGFQKGASKLGDIVKGLGVFKLIEKGFQLITQSIDAAVSRYDTLNRYPKLMEQMGYGADAAQASMKKLSDGIDGLPTTLDSIIAETQKLVISTQSLEKGTDSALALNNAFIASNASVDEASRGMTQYVQMLSNGTPDIVSWRTLTETMNYALIEVAKSFGFAGARATDDLYQALKDGDVTFMEMNDRFIELSEQTGGFADLAKEASGGIGTAWTNLKTAMVRGTTEIISSIDRGLSKTRFKSIENVINSMKNAVLKSLSLIAKGFEFVAANSEVLIPILLGIGAAVVGWKIGAMLSSISKSFSSAAKDVVTYALSVNGAVTADALQTAGLTTKEILVGVLTGKIGLATAAQYLWNAAMNANPIGLMIAAATILIGVIAGVIAIFGSKNEAYKQHKEEVKELTKAEKELADASSENEMAYTALSLSIEAISKLAGGLMDELEELASSTGNASEKANQMELTVSKLNTAVDGLNIAYDKETGKIKNINTGQEISIDQLKQLVAAKTELAKANAYQERANELIGEQVKIEEELILIEAKREDILNDVNLTTRQRNKLLKELDKAEEGYASTLEDNELRLEIVNGNIAESNTNMAESVVSDYELMEASVSSTGESIEEVAAKWKVSVDEIIADMQREGITLDEWVAQHEEGFEDLQSSVTERTSAITNSFDEIPKKFDKSAKEMLENLKSNKEAYARWEQNMEEITKQLGPTAAAEFEKLGPEANSAMEEILGSADMLDQYRDVFGVKIDETTGLAVENWNDPNFIGAPADAIDSSAQVLAESDALPNAAGGKIGETKEALESAVESEDFTSVGESIAEDVGGGVESTDFAAVGYGMAESIAEGALGFDMSGIMDNIVSAVQTGAGKVTTAFTAISKAVITVVNAMGKQAKTATTQMMTGITTVITAKAITIKTAFTTMGSGIVSALNGTSSQAVAAVTKMMTNIGVAVSAQSVSVLNAAKSLSSGIVSNLSGMITGAKQATVQMIDGILVAMNNKASELYAKARSIATNIADTMKKALDVRSPSRVMINIFTDVMKGVYNGLDGMADKVYKLAENISDEVAERLTATPTLDASALNKLQSLKNANPLGASIAGMQVAYAGNTTVVNNHTTNLTQNVTTPKPLSESELSKQGEAFLKRSKWQLK